MAKSRTPPLADNDLLVYSQVHLKYEMSMFFEAAHYLGQLTTAAATEQLVMNVFYESFVLHFRNLAEFLCNEKPWPDDVVARDFFADPSSWARPTTSALFDEHRTRANKELAHLTTARRPEGSPDRNWPVSDLLTETTQLLKDFISQSSTARFHTDVEKVLNDCSFRSPATVTIPGSGSLTGGTYSIL